MPQSCFFFHLMWTYTCELWQNRHIFFLHIDIVCIQTNACKIPLVCCTLIEIHRRIVQQCVYACTKDVRIGLPRKGQIISSTWWRLRKGILRGMLLNLLSSFLVKIWGWFFMMRRVKVTCNTIWLLLSILIAWKSTKKSCISLFHLF